MMPFLVLTLIIVGVFGGLIANQARIRRRRREYLDALGPSREPLPRTPDCPRCRGRMTAGFMIDRMHGGCAIATWSDGWPRKLGWNDTVQTNFERSIPVITFRCTSCGLLENYARPEIGRFEAADDGKKPAGYSEL